MASRFGDFKINDYRESNFESVAMLFREVYIETYPHFNKRFHEIERFRKILSEHVLPESKVWTAEYDGEIVGFAAIAENFIDQLYVRKTFRDKGLGSYWIEKAKMMYPDFLELYTFDCNEKSVAFYKKHDFKVIEKGIAPDEKMPDVKMRWESVK